MKFRFTKKKIIIASIFIGIFISGFLITFFVLKLFKAPVKNTPLTTPASNVSESVNFGKDTEPVPEKGVYNTVFLGYGGVGHSGSLLTDSIIIIHINTNNKTAALISIPRDLWVTGNHKINAEASINGFANEGGVIKSVTGLPVNYFVAVDFAGFVKLIDNLGGITVDVPKTFDDTFYPVAGLENETCGKTPEEIAELKTKYSDAQLEMQFTCRYEHLHFDKGPATLDGATALKFVRSRHGDSDFGRSARQFAVLKGILAKLISLKAFDNTGGTIKSLLSIVRTNLNLEGINSLLAIIGEPSQYKIASVHLSTDNVLTEGRSSQGAYILNPKAGIFNFTEVKSFISSSIN